MAAEGDSSSNSEGINVGSQDGAQQRHQDSDDRIYARGANLYWKAGWRAPLPFKPGTKVPAPLRAGPAMRDSGR